MNMNPHLPKEFRSYRDSARIKIDRQIEEAMTSLSPTSSAYHNSGSMTPPPSPGKARSKRVLDKDMRAAVSTTIIQSSSRNYYTKFLRNFSGRSRNTGADAPSASVALARVGYYTTTSWSR